MTEAFDSTRAKQAMIAYCTKKGALAFGGAFLLQNRIS